MATKTLSLDEGYQLLPNRLVRNVYVIEAKGTIFYKHYSDIQCADGFDSHMFSGFVAAIQSFAKQIGEREVKEIALGNRLLYCSIDIYSSMIFVVECDTNTKSKKIRQVLEKTKSLFVNLFLGNLNADDQIKSKIISELKKRLSDMLGEPSEVENFLYAI